MQLDKALFHDSNDLFKKNLYFRLFFILKFLLDTVVLLSTVQLSESAICIHISPFFWIYFPFSGIQNVL